MSSSSHRRVVAAATLLMVGRVAAAQGGAFPWHAGDKAPRLAGFTLGQSLDSVRKAIGDKAQIDSVGKGETRIYTFTSATKSIVVSALKTQGAGVLSVRDRTSGEIDGVRVGDACADVLKKWGKPTKNTPVLAMWIAGPWLVRARCSAKKIVVELTVANAV